MNELPNADAKARDAALAAAGEVAAAGTAVIEYRSRGRVLIIGSGEAPDAVAYMLPSPLSARILRLDDDALADDVSVPLAERELSIEGHLGAFVVHLGAEGQPGHQVLSADLLLDLCEPPRLSAPLKPPGYFVSDTEPASLEAVAEEMGEYSGTFEKPRYFEYDAAICAHGRSGQAGCNRCVEACPAEAITGLVETIEVDPYRCQGGGACATVCPTGAIRYAYPRPADSLARIGRMLKAYRAAGGADPVVALVSEADMAAFGPLPDNIMTVELEELASVGLDTWLSALAYGAHQVVVLRGESVPGAVDPTIDEQLAIGRAILDHLGYARDTLASVVPGETPPATPTLPAGARKVMHGAMNDKRNMLFAAIDTLAAHRDNAGDVVPLPDGAPFGRVQVDGGKCTLCMGCTSVCPAQALAAGGETPRLVFHEINCVQCGICARACPEQAITLEPRLNLDVDGRRRGVTAHEEAPFHCVQCGKAFATRSVIDRMLDKLKDHPMFASERARRRLKMCDNCRVVDVVQDDDAMNNPV